MNAAQVLHPKALIFPARNAEQASTRPPAKADAVSPEKPSSLTASVLPSVLPTSAAAGDTAAVRSMQISPAVCHDANNQLEIEGFNPNNRVPLTTIASAAAKKLPRSRSVVEEVLAELKR